jgi:glycosyltransferase domain-containing protein
MDLDKKLTVLLVIKDRVPYTLRWMTYANKISFPFKVLIADGGKDENLPKVLENPANFHHVSYKYIRYPYDQTYTHFYAKMADALSQVDTEFVAIIDNSAFCIIKGLRQAVGFLAQHGDYSVCGGNIGAFTVGPDDIKSEFNPAYGKEVEFFSDLYRFRQIEETTAAARVAAHFALYCPTYYDVHRAKQASSYFNILKELDLKDIFLAELLTSFLSAAAGKVRREPSLFMLRQKKDRGSSAGDHRKKSGDTFDRMLAGSWSDDFTGFEKAVAAGISAQDGISMDLARQQVKQGYRIHIAPELIRLLSPRQTRARQGVLFNWLKQQVRKLKYDSWLRWFFHKLYGSIPIPIHRTSEFYQDVKPLQDFLTSQPPKEL